jgi:predicted dehydrogenase
MSHVRAYQAVDGLELVGLCTRNASARADLDTAFPGVPRFDGLTEALEALKPDAGSINTYSPASRMRSRWVRRLGHAT